jgi:hypothetical protein
MYKKQAQKYIKIRERRIAVREGQEMTRKAYDE